MDDVIILSDDEEPVKNAAATVHIGEVRRLNLNDLGITSNVRFGMPKVLQTRALSMHQNATNGNRNKPLPSAPRKRSSTTNLENIRPPKQRLDNYEEIVDKRIEEYIFEAFYETTRPQRRSTRFSTKKKVDGKFVCTFNTRKCVKVSEDIVTFINHLWAHVNHDIPGVVLAGTEQNMLMQNCDPAILTTANENNLKKLRTCQYCSLSFRTVHQRTVHENAVHVHTNSPTVCYICEKNFDSVAIFRSHMYEHNSKEAPYSCKQCRYRTSIRSFLFEHYLDNHTKETILCPICLWQCDLPTSVRANKFVNVNSYVTHMRQHARPNGANHCNMCALNFLSPEELCHHRNSDHNDIPSNWTVKTRRLDEGPSKTRTSLSAKITALQKQFFTTKEGQRIADEVSCSSMMERGGYDTSSTGNVLYQCKCGKLNSYNGNRAASHFHRCRSHIYDIQKDVQKHHDSDCDDEQDEIKLFNVYPPFSDIELFRIRKKKKNNEEVDEGGELRLRETVLPEISDLPTIRLTSYKLDKKMEERIAEILKKVAD
ncbi:unnamed protein product [Caenorhabditis bovis]|uniref:C2H2-type domain-containing protein n=1 Tax=Caenorhabditis bovis TaxID=2654633 RepID=A0A8S1F4G8_9PELO|nr:unnamed protein product [Caenorhabditis bovis]